MAGKSKPIIWNITWKETAGKCVGGIIRQGRGDVPPSIQNKLLKNLGEVFLITRVTESPLHTPLFKLSLYIPAVVNQLLFPALLQVFQTAPSRELHPSGQFTQPDQQRLMIVQMAVSLNMVGSSNKELGNKIDTQIQFSGELCSFSWFLTWINLLLPANYSQSDTVIKNLALFLETGGIFNVRIVLPRPVLDQ